MCKLLEQIKNMILTCNQPSVYLQSLAISRKPSRMELNVSHQQLIGFGITIGQFLMIPTHCATNIGLEITTY